MNKLSIAIVAYRNYADVIVAIDTIREYTSNQISKKIYIVDNSNYLEKNEEQIAFINKVKNYSDVKYINPKENLGFGKGHNVLLDELNSKYHAIVNPDIILQEDVFSKLIDYMEQNPDVQMTIPRMTDQYGKMQAVYRRKITVLDVFLRMFIKKGFQKRKDYHTMQDMDYTKEFEVPFGQGSFLVIRTSLFKEIHGFDDEYFMYLEDADLCNRVWQKGKLMYVPNATVIHKWEKGSHKNLKLMRIHFHSMYIYFKKWGIKWK